MSAHLVDPREGSIRLIHPVLENGKPFQVLETRTLIFLGENKEPWVRRESWDSALHPGSPPVARIQAKFPLCGSRGITHKTELDPVESHHALRFPGF